MFNLLIIFCLFCFAGPRQGIAYTTDSTATATHMTEFSHIQSIQTLEILDNKSKSLIQQKRRGVLQLRVAGSSELLTVTCPTIREAENIADLIDGYCRLVNHSATSIWNRKGNYVYYLLFILSMKNRYYIVLFFFNFKKSIMA